MSEIKFRCPHELAPCIPEIDTAYANFKGIQPYEMGRILEPVKGMGFTRPNKAVCDVCNTESRNPVCPHCHSSFGTPKLLDSKTIAIIGNRSTGKSIYIATLITSLENHARKFGFNFFPLIDSGARFRKRFYEPLYKDNELLAQTAAEEDISMPFIYRLEKSSPNRHMNLVFYDLPGEYFNDRERWTLYVKYIFNTSGIIILEDPLDFNAFPTHDAPAAQHSGATGTRDENLTNSLVQAFEQQGLMGENDKFKIPTAVAMTKADVYKHLMVNDQVLQTESDHSGGFDLREAQNTSHILKRYISQWGNDPLLNMIESKFTKSMVFGFSALGAPPHGQQIQRIAPFRVMDPFLWILWELGFMRSKAK